MSIAKLNLIKKHKGSDLGWFWSIVKPLMYVVMFYGAISLGFRNSKDIPNIHTPYIVWMAAGFFPWFYMQDEIISGANCFIRNRALMVKAKVPAVTIPMINAINEIFTHLIIILVLFGLTVIFGGRPTLYWLQIPIYTLLMLAFTYLWNFSTGLLTVLSSDTLDLIRAIKPAFFWLSGILFNSRAPGRSRIYFIFNPITYLVEGYRNAICYDQWIWEDKEGFAGFMLVFFIFLLVTLLLYRKLKRRLPELI